MRRTWIIRNVDQDMKNEFLKWCAEKGIAVTGRNARTGEILGEIITAHIRNKTAARYTKRDELRQVLDRAASRYKFWIPAKILDGIVMTVMDVYTLPSVRQYASIIGYEYDRRRKSYRIPDRVTTTTLDQVRATSDGKERIGPDEEKILEATMKHAEQVLADQDKLPLNDGGIKPEEKKGSERAGARSRLEKRVKVLQDLAGHEPGKVDAARHQMPVCPVCNLPVHSRQSSVEDRPAGKTYHEECYQDRARTVKITSP